MKSIDLFQVILSKKLIIGKIYSGINPNPHVSLKVLKLDTAMIMCGFKLSRDVLYYLANLSDTIFEKKSKTISSTILKMIGANAKHQPYFIDFPNNVPDTAEFWMGCLFDALVDETSRDKIIEQFFTGTVNLLDLPKYGKVQHTYREMLEHHERLDPFVKRKLKVIHLGNGEMEEEEKLLHELASSTIPLNEDDISVLEFLMNRYPDEIFETVPIRENLCIINEVWLKNGTEIYANTITDILRLACHLSGGDISLQEVTKFNNIPRPSRRLLLQKLNEIVKYDNNCLEDVLKYKERWKRLSEILHPFEYSTLIHAHKVFKVARNQIKIESFNSKVDKFFSDGNLDGAINLLSVKPGLFLRSMDRILSHDNFDTEEIIDLFLDKLRSVVPNVSGKVLLSIHNYLENRKNENSHRLFFNQKGTVWVTDGKKSIDKNIIDLASFHINKEFAKRLPDYSNVIIDPTFARVAIPSSEKNIESGFNVIPRGSIQKINPDADIVRIFAHWKQQSCTTDYDLSILELDCNYEYKGQVSWTSLKIPGLVHSGDITSAPKPKGATEFIELQLSNISKDSMLIPQLLIYSGESYDEVDECFMGLMERNSKEKGKPFEASTVTVKSDVSGKGKIYLPYIIYNENDEWFIKWIHVYASGTKFRNIIETNTFNTSILTKSIMDLYNMDTSFVSELLGNTTIYDPDKEYIEDEKSCYFGFNKPENIPDSFDLFTPSNLSSIVPA